MRAGEDGEHVIDGRFELLQRLGGGGMQPSMSTVRLDRDTMGRQAMPSLLALINGRPPLKSHVDSTFEIAPRGSSGPAPR